MLGALGGPIVGGLLLALTQYLRFALGYSPMRVGVRKAGHRPHRGGRWQRRHGPRGVRDLAGRAAKERAGVGSAVNDTVSQVGQALSVAVLGSILTAAYAAKMPGDISGPARHSIGAALAVAAARGDAALATTAKAAFTDAMATIAIVGVAGSLVAAVAAFLILEARPPEQKGAAAEPAAEPAPDEPPPVRTVRRRSAWRGTPGTRTIGVG